MNNMDNMNNNDIENEIDNIIENTTYNLYQCSVDKQLNNSNSTTQILNEELDLDLVNIIHNNTESYENMVNSNDDDNDNSNLDKHIITSQVTHDLDSSIINIPSIEDALSVEDSPSVDAPSIDVFNEALHQYLRIDVEIKTLSLALKTRTDIKKKLSETLTNFLNTKQIKTVNLDGSYKGKRLETVVSKTIHGFNRKNVTETLYNELIDDQELFDKIMNILSHTCVTKEVSKLQLITDKQASTQVKLTKSKPKTKTNILDEASELLFND